MNPNIYALYQGDRNIMDGAVMEIAEKQGMKIERMLNWETTEGFNLFAV